MAVNVGELVDQPHLRIEVLAGARGLANPVTWAHSSDLAEPWDWLSGGEMLMKNGRTLGRTARAQIAFLDGLAGARAAALVIGADPATPKITRQALGRADELALPLLQVPYSMSFIVLSRAVADALSAGDSQRMARAGRIYATIHAAVAGSTPGTFLRRLEAELRCRLFVLDKETSEPVLAGTAAPDRWLRTALIDALESRGGAVPGLLRLSGHGRRTAAVVEVPYEEPTLLVATSSSQLFDILLLQHAAAAIAVEMAHESTREEAERQVGSELLRRLFDSPVDVPAVEERLSGYGINPAISRLIAIRGADPEAQRRLQVGLRRWKVNHLMLSRSTLVFLLVSGPEAAGQAVAVASGRLGAAMTAGVSDIVGSAGRITEAAREATWMLSVADHHGQAVGVHGETAPPPMFHDPDEARALVERVLGPLLAYDRANHGQLVASLRTFLACRRSWQRTAAALAVHRQTVVYRMDRVRQLTGRSLSETADLAELWMAVTALDLLEGPAT